MRRSPLFWRLSAALRRLHCWALYGHDDVLHIERGRMQLRCYSCGYQSPGWNVNGSPSPAPTRAKVIRFPLLGDRRIA